MNAARAFDSNPGDLATLVGDVTEGIERAHDGLDATGLHDLRVALARLMAALRILKYGSSGYLPAGLRHEIRWLRRRLGAARDRDVFAAHPAVRKSCRHSIQFESAAAHARLVARDELSDTIHSRRCLDLLAVLRRLRLSQDAGRPVSKREASRYVMHQLRRIRRASRHPDHLDATRLHRLRGHVRSLRYVCEFLARWFPEQAAFARPLSTLQKTLGLLNDSFLVHRLAQDVIEDDEQPQMRAITAHHRAEVRKLRRRLRHELKALDQAG